MRLSALAASLLLMFLGAPAAATEDEELLSLVYGDKSTVSIATGSRQSLRRAPAVATVITAEDIAAMGATDLDEVLESVPGVHVSRNTQAYTPLYVIRGIYSELNPQTLMLLNGVPLTTLLVGNRGIGWGGFPVEHIARIEVIRGPGSALYGADAYSGVINIVTKTAAETPDWELGGRVGSFKTRDGWLQYGGKAGRLELAAYLRLGTTDGFKSTVSADAQSALDPLFGTQASLAPGPVNTMRDALDGGLNLSRGNLRFRASYSLRRDMGSGAGVASALDPVGRFRTQRFTADMSWNDVELARDWKLTLAASHLHYTQNLPVPLQLFPPGAFGNTFPDGMFGAPNTWERQTRLSAVVNFAGWANHQPRIGVGRDDLDMYRTQEFGNFILTPGLPTLRPGGAVVEIPADEAFLTPHRRTVSYVYLQDEWNFARDWTLTAGVRHDHYSDFGNTTNPRAALVWDASHDLTVKLLYGRAFRAPDFAEQYSVNPVISGNPNLKPERIATLEAAVSWQPRADTQVNLSLFRYDMKDIIRTSGAGGSTMFANVGAQRGHGAELEGIWDASRSLRLSGHYAHQRSTDEETGRDAGFAPHHHLYGRADWRFASGWLLGAQLNHVAGRKRPAGDARPEVPDYTTLDLTLRTGRGKRGWEFSASVRNLFNADVREPSATVPSDLPMAPRSFYLQAAYRL